MERKFGKLEVKKGMMVCPKCGQRNNPGAECCWACGYDFIPNEPKKAEVNYELIGDDMQAVRISLSTGEVIKAEAGAMMYMTDTIKMDTGMEGGIFSGLKRMMVGETFFITSFKCVGSQGKVCFSAPYPGKILPLELKGDSILCQRDAYLCSTKNIDIGIAFTKRIGAGFFGGEGFILQKLSGQGMAFLHAGGTITEHNLSSGQSLRVDTGCLVAFEPTVSYEIKFVGGVKTAFFGGEGIFFAYLRGPGKVYLQTLPFSRLADKISSAARWRERPGAGSILSKFGGK